MKYLAEEKTMRGQYVVVLVVNKKIKGTLISGWWQTPEEIKAGKCYAAAVARSFFVTAGVLIYRAAEDDEGKKCWQLWDSCDAQLTDYSDSGILYRLPHYVMPK